MTHMTSEQAAARADLIARMENWRKRQAAVAAERDTLIREGAADKMSNTEVAAHLGINRGTVIRTLGIDGDSTEGQES
jgi:DNA invertase Pin-like site-specific DNA recombinase